MMHIPWGELQIYLMLARPFFISKIKNQISKLHFKFQNYKEIQI